MFELSMSSALVNLIIANILGFFVMLFIRKKYKNSVLCINYFVVYYILTAFGTSLILFGNSIPMWIGVIVSNVILITAKLVWVHAVFLLYDFKNKDKSALVFIVLFTISFVYFTFWNNIVAARVFIFSFSAMIIHLFASIAIHISNKERNRKHDFILIVSIIYTILFVIRISVLLVFSEMQTNFTDYNFDSYLVNSEGLFGLLFTVGALSLINRKSNERLIESESEFRAMFNTAGLAIGYYTPEGEVIWFNKIAADNMGGVPDDFKGKKLWDLLGTEKAEKYYKRINLCINSLGQIEFEDEHESPSGKLYFRSIYNCVHGENDELKGVQVISQSITDLKRSEKALFESRQIFRMMFDEAPLPYQSLDANGNYLEVNKAWTELLGYDKDEIVGRWFGALIVPESRQHLKEKFPEFKSSGAASTFFDIQKKNGDIVKINFHGRIGHHDDGSFRQTHCILQDITDIKKAERLEIEKQKAEESGRLKSAFLANMSHEIRTPINAIIGLNELMSTTELTQKQREYVDKAAGSSETLLHIINDILDISKIESGYLSIEDTKFSIEDILARIKDTLGLVAERKGIEFIIDIDTNVPDEMIGDPLRLEQIINNLVSNAIKFTESGEVIIGIKLLSDVDSILTLQISVKDTGIGMTNEQVENIFEPFTQADISTTRKYGGTGLGLVISKNLVEMMGGEIGVKSDYGNGSEFFFTIQVYKVENSEIKLNDSHLKLSLIRSSKILIVIENNYTRNVISKYLVNIGNNPKLLSCGEEAIEELKEEQYDVVIMDCKMKNLSGVDTWHMVREMLETSKIPKCILVTAYGTYDMIKAAQTENIDNVIIKPVTPSKLFDGLMKSLQNDIEEEYLNEHVSKELPPIDKNLSGVKVLLVEDNEINQMVAKELLELKGFTVDIADNGKLAVEKFTNNYSCDIILMDLQMPVMDGYEATKLIRQIDGYKNIPIIALSADAMKGTEEDALKAGMNDYISKPINIEELFNKISRVVK